VSKATAAAETTQQAILKRRSASADFAQAVAVASETSEEVKLGSDFKERKPITSWASR
jgi:hypothetical protein